MLPRFVIAFLPRSKCLLISWLQSLSAVIWIPKKIKSVTVSIVSPSICHEVKGPDAMIFVFWMQSFKLAFLLSSFTYIKRLFSSSLLSAIGVVPSASLRLLIFLPPILIPACDSSILAFCMICSAYKLKKQGDNIQTWRTPSPIWVRVQIAKLIFQSSILIYTSVIETPVCLFLWTLARISTIVLVVFICFYVGFIEIHWFKCCFS